MANIDWRRKNADILWNGNRGQIIKGAFNATTGGYGLQVSGDRQWIERGNADDGGSLIATNGAYLFGSRRLLLTAAHTGSSLSFFGGCDRLSINADLSGSSAEMAGHWGFLEVKAGAKCGTQASCYRADISLPSTAVIPSGGVASCFMAAAESLAGTHTGSATVLHVPNPQAGVFDYLAILGATTGCHLASYTGNSAFVPNNKGTFTQCGQLKIKIDSTDYFIPYGTVA
jgi:hypothetical protein